MAIERILVPLDGSDLAEAALETALELVSEQPATHLVLLRAAEAPTRAAGVGHREAFGGSSGRRTICTTARTTSTTAATRADSRPLSSISNPAIIRPLRYEAARNSA